MPVFNKEKHLSMRMDHIRFGKEELERRRKSPIHVKAEEIETQLDEHFHVYIVDPRLGFNHRSFRFWIDRRPLEDEPNQRNRKLGHRHTVEAVITILRGYGYSIIDGVKYEWKAGDSICVPVFGWHRHVNESGEGFLYVAATTGPFSMAMGVALYEEEEYPEYWVFAQQSKEAMETLIPGGAEGPAEGSHIDFDPERWKPEDGAADSVAQLYYEQLAYAGEEEKRRRAGKVIAKGDELVFGSTPMGRIAYVVDPRIGYHAKLLNTLMAEIPPGKHSGAHRHIYEEVNYVLSGEGYSIIEDQRVEWGKGDALMIPVFAWHQHFNTGKEQARFLVHTNRVAMENTGYVHTQQGEPADY